MIVRLNMSIRFSKRATLHPISLKFVAIITISKFARGDWINTTNFLL